MGMGVYVESSLSKKSDQGYSSFFSYSDPLHCRGGLGDHYGDAYVGQLKHPIWGYSATAYNKTV